MTAVDNGVSSLGFCEISTPRFGGKRLDLPGKPEKMGSMVPNNQEKDDNDTLCTTLVETNIERDKRDAQLMMESHRILAPQNYKVRVSLSDKGR